MNDFISKPVNLEMIQKLMDKWLVHKGVEIDTKKATPSDTSSKYLPIPPNSAQET